MFFNSRYLLFLLAVFNTAGIVPKINPIKQNFEVLGYKLYITFNMFPNKTVPIIIPIIIGISNFKFSFKLLKKLSIELISFSYNPKETKITPLLIPGKILPKPIKIPIKIFFKKVIKLKIPPYFSNNKIIQF